MGTTWRQNTIAFGTNAAKICFLLVMHPLYSAGNRHGKEPTVEIQCHCAMLSGSYFVFSYTSFADWTKLADVLNLHPPALH